VDYAFVPAAGNLRAVADALSSHPNTTVLTVGCDTIGDFLAAVESASASPLGNLAEDLILAAHVDEGAPFVT
jgi:hypothetical protein